MTSKHECDAEYCSVLTTNQRFCSKRCSAVTTNSESPRRKKRSTVLCLFCSTETSNKKYCSKECGPRHLAEVRVARWIAGEIELGATAIRSHFIRTRGECCEECGWSKRHRLTSRVPLALDHIDGNWKNNSIENLRLLCPNCHSLTDTFGYLNSNAVRAKFGLPSLELSRRAAGVM